MMSSKVRVRFAPSPTGPLHIGGVRTALFNYIFAKKHNGTFILRIEDTDQNRYVEGAEQYIIDALNWCGIPYDEGVYKEGNFAPYRQSERKELYKKYADQLIEKGHAYYAFDTPKALDDHRKDYEENGKTFIYNWHNRLKLTNSLALSEAETQSQLASNTPYVVRFKTPQDQKLVLTDLIRGKIEIDTNILDDKVLFKSDGMPTYHLANIVDDYLMEISHVIRGEEWLPSLALHKQLYDAFEWPAPEFAHLPLIMKPVGKGKLSKRDGDKDSIGYKESGYFPEAVINFLALLGWNPGTEQEIFSLEDLIQSFDLQRVNKSGARFDPDKTKWYNQHYLQHKTNKELALLFMPILEKNLGTGFKTTNVERVVSLIKERASFVTDFWELSDYFFIPPSTFAEKAVKKQWKDDTAQLMQSVSNIIENQKNFSSENIENTLKEWISSQELSFGRIMAPLRLIIVGDMKGPHLFDIIEMLGKEESIARINKAIKILK
ncbi:UNVERIFIED_CONTAM: hypothetical protein GTU68_006249 [Idotea baltica]|nr:hypothetical protein [Idotea baltica]